MVVLARSICDLRLLLIPMFCSPCFLPKKVNAIAASAQAEHKYADSKRFIGKLNCNA